MVSRISNFKKVWQTVIGLEIHAQINSKTKLFSVASNNFNSAPNSQVSYFDMATPGTLPIINGRCIELALTAALALKCEIEPLPEFDRKHYFYSDMPAGYQITQHRRPIGRNGKLKFMWSHDNNNSNDIHCSEVMITQIHIEQDSGKSLHDYNRNRSLIDLNRAGVGLLEIVTAPDFKSSFDAAGFVKELKDVLSDLGVCNGHMEQGALRVDANVSVKPIESSQLGERAEIKNIGSIRGILKAIEFESQRQINLLESGGTVINETRFYNPNTESTFSMRDKETLQDYRYYPEPNLPPLQLRQHCQLLEDGRCAHKLICIQCAKNRLENYVYPSDKRQFIISKYSLSISSANTIFNEPGLYPFMLSVSEFSPKNYSIDDSKHWFKLLGHLTVTFFLGELRARSLTATCCSISAEKFAEFVTISKNKLTTIVKLPQVLKLMFDFPAKSPESIIKENKWARISDLCSIEDIVRDFIKRHPGALKDHKAGKKGLDKFFKKKINTENDNLLDQKMLVNIINNCINEQ